jgi:hypothetical protein
VHGGKVGGGGSEFCGTRKKLLRNKKKALAVIDINKSTEKGFASFIKVPGNKTEVDDFIQVPGNKTEVDDGSIGE